MKRNFTLMTGLFALAALCGLQEAKADRYSDYWLPENMAKRQCASVHLGYGPTIHAHTAAYQEAVIEKSAPGTYFACNNFGCVCLLVLPFYLFLLVIMVMHLETINV